MWKVKNFQRTCNKREVLICRRNTFFAKTYNYICCLRFRHSGKFIWHANFMWNALHNMCCVAMQFMEYVLRYEKLIPYYDCLLDKIGSLFYFSKGKVKTTFLSRVIAVSKMNQNCILGFTLATLRIVLIIQKYNHK